MTSSLSSNHENNDEEDRKSSTSTPTKKSSRRIRSALKNNGEEWENVDREVEEFRRMLEQNTSFSPETRPKIKIDFPKDAFSKMKTTTK